MQKFLVDPHNPEGAVSAALEYINDRLNHCSLKPKDRNRAELMAEESLLKLTGSARFTEGQAIFVNVRNFLGNVRITLTVPGREINFAENLNISLPFNDEGMPETQEVIQNILIHSFEDKLRYSHSGGFNTIRINAVTSNKNQLYLTAAAFIFAIIAGVLLKSFASESFYMAVDNIFLVRAKTMYMNALKCVVTILVFLSIVTCLSQFRSFSEIGRVGAKVVGLFVINTFIASSIGVGIFYLFRPGGGINLASSSSAPAVSMPQTDMITNIIPSSFLQPFLSMNMFQVLFLAFLSGAALGMTGRHAKTLRDFFESCCQLFMAMTKIIMRFVPLGAFCSILSAMLETDGQVLLSLAGFMVVGFVGIFCVAGLDSLELFFLGRLNPLQFFRKYLPTMMIAATSSTSACIPNNMQACEEMGVPKRIHSFTIPLGATISLDGGAMYAALSALTLANIYGVHPSAGEVLSLIVSDVILTISAPGIYGAALACMSVLIVQLGVPAEALGIIMGVYALQQFMLPVGNCMGAVVSTVVVSSREGVLDRKAYYDSLQ